MYQCQEKKETATPMLYDWTDFYDNKKCQKTAVRLVVN